MAETAVAVFGLTFSTALWSTTCWSWATRDASSSWDLSLVGTLGIVALMFLVISDSTVV